METSKKRIGWILIAGILLITAAALVTNTFSNSSAQTDPVLQEYEGTLRELFPQTGDTANVFERMDNGEGGFICRVRQADGDAYAVQQTVQGYAGPVEVITALKADGTILGIHVGGRDFKETEGLGGKARDEAFTGQFREKKLPVTLGNEIDAISGATVTSQAVVDAVNLTLESLQDIPGLALSPSPTFTPEAGESRQMTANASTIGYGGPVLVRLTLDDQGKIAALDVGGARFAETEGVGSRVRDESFTQTLIGLTPPLTLNEDVDAISGATISSQAVVEAINDAAAFLTQNHSPSDTN